MNFLAPIIPKERSDFIHLPIFKEILNKTKGPDLAIAVDNCYEESNLKLVSWKIRSIIFRGTLE